MTTTNKRTWIAAAAVMALLLGACGTRRTHAELAAAQGGGTTASVRGASRPAASTSSATAADSVAGSSTATGDEGVAAGGSGSASQGAGAAGSPGGGGVTAAQGAPLTKSTVRIGLVGSISGVAGEGFAPMAEGVRVWAKYIDDHGGLNGHPVDLVVGDDGGDPSRHRALVQELVEQDGVIAFVANPEALTGPGSVDYLTSVGVPVIGSEGAGEWFYESPVYFPQGSSGMALLQAGVAGVAAYMSEHAMTKVGYIACVEVQVCRDGYDKGPALYQKYGIDLVYRAEVSLAQPDFTAECLNAQSKGVQMLSIGLPASQIRGIARSCARQGYHPIITIPAGAATADMKTDPNLDGLFVLSSTQGWTNTGSAAIAELHAAMQQYAPSSEPTGGHALAWTAAKILELAATDLPEPATARDLLVALGNIHGDVLPDLTAPVLFNPGQPATHTVCNFAVVLADGQFTTWESGRRVCAEFDASI